MRSSVRSALVVAISGALAFATPEVTAAAPRPTPAKFSLRGTVSAVSAKGNHFTLTVKKHHYVMVTSSTTAITMRTKRIRLTRLSPGHVVRVTGRRIGTLYLAFVVTG